MTFVGANTTGIPCVATLVLPGTLRAIHTAVQFLLSSRPSSTAQYYTGDPGYGAPDSFDENSLARAFLSHLDDGPFLGLRH